MKNGYMALEYVLWAGVAIWIWWEWLRDGNR